MRRFMGQGSEVASQPMLMCQAAVGVDEVGERQVSPTAIQDPGMRASLELSAAVSWSSPSPISAVSSRYYLHAFRS
jgi:hypothetical protein